jgi:hypothetical protein
VKFCLRTPLFALDTVRGLRYNKAASAQVVVQLFFAAIAQLVEQRTENPRVGGSIPSRGTLSDFCENVFSQKSSCGLWITDCGRDEYSLNPQPPSTIRIFCLSYMFGLHFGARIFSS